MVKMAKITPHLWYSKEAEKAAEFYARIFPDSRVTALANESPRDPALRHARSGEGALRSLVRGADLQSATRLSISS
jgi:hypothetical protein